MLDDNLTTDVIAEQTWDEAFGAFSQVDAAYDDLIARHSAAEEAADVECPREGRFFDTYGLTTEMDRERAVRALGWYTMRTGDPANAERIADEFQAYMERSRAADERHGLKELDAQIEAVGGRWQAVRHALMQVPAPDVPALLAKLKVAIHSLNDDYGDSALADAKRLLG